MSASVQSTCDDVALIVSDERACASRVGRQLRSAGRPTYVAHGCVAGECALSRTWACAVVFADGDCDRALASLRHVRRVQPRVPVAVIVSAIEREAVNGIADLDARLWMEPVHRHNIEAFACDAIARRALRHSRPVADVVSELARGDDLEAREVAIVAQSASGASEEEVCAALRIGGRWRKELVGRALAKTRAARLDELVNRILVAVVHGGTAVRPVSRVGAAR